MVSYGTLDMAKEAECGCRKRRNQALLSVAIAILDSDLESTRTRDETTHSRQLVGVTLV